MGSIIAQGKIYAPELLNIPLQELLTSLSTHGVVGIRKLLQDQAKANSPPFVVSIFCPKLPESVRIGYAICNLDPYCPNPLRCTNCWKWGHTKATCNGKVIRSRCGRSGLISEDCASETTVAQILSY